jgi:hypothetical protein
MKKLLTASVLALTALAGMAQTTTDAQGVTTSTDPAKAAAVERQAAEMKATQEKVATSGTSSKQHARHAKHHHRHHKAVAAK